MILKTEELEKRLNSRENISSGLKGCKKFTLTENESSARTRTDNSEANPPKIVSSTRPSKIKGDPAFIPSHVRDLLAITRATSEETNQEIADTFNTTQNSVSLIKRGLEGYKKDSNIKGILDSGRERARKQREEKQQKLNEKNENIHELALDSLVSTLTSLNPKLKDSELRADKLANVASHLSKVVANTRKNQEESEDSNKPRIILFAPNIKQENYYESLEA